MVIKVYLSGISASKEVKKRQQRTLLILDSCKVDYESIDITEPGMEEIREFMTQNSKIREPNKTPIAPQFFNEDVYCGDYEDFDSAVEINQVLPFLKLESDEYSLNGMPSTNGHKKDEENEGKASSPPKEHDNQVEEDEELEAEDEGESKERESEGKEEESAEDVEDIWADQDDNKKRKTDTVETTDETDDVEGDVADDTNKRIKVDGEEEGGQDNEKEREEGDGEEEEEDEGGFWGTSD